VWTASWTGLFITVLIAGAYLVYYWNDKKKRAIKRAVTSVGKSKIGGDWTLVDHTGSVVSRATLKGKYLLLYFGFTFCPDICPEELKKMSRVINDLDKTIGPGLVQPVFISLDPWRDSVEQVAVYVKGFHPRILGLTGTPQQCEDIARAFRVYTTTNRKTDDQEDYAVDHSIWLYLLDKEGQYLDIFGTDKDDVDIAEKIKDYMYQRNEAREPIIRKIKKFAGNRLTVVESVVSISWVGSIGASITVSV
jgi:protein SCO1/2